MVGDYTPQGDSSITISFKENGTIQGFENMETYRVKNWFGTLHWLPKDLIYFRSKNKKAAIWAWKFDANKLILNKVEGLEDDMHVTNNQIILHKLNAH